MLVPHLFAATIDSVNGQLEVGITFYELGIGQLFKGVDIDGWVLRHERGDHFNLAQWLLFACLRDGVRSVLGDVALEGFKKSLSKLVLASLGTALWVATLPAPSRD